MVEQSNILVADLSAKDVAKSVKACPTTILRAFRGGKLRGYKLGPRMVRFAQEDVAEWLRGARVGGAQ